MKKYTVLIIEDEQAIRDMLRFSLPTKEFQLFDAENVNAALQFLSTQIPDMIVLDWMLPDKSGISFIQAIKKDEIYKDIPIIMLTAKAEAENKIKGLTVGADDYMTKPFSPNELVARMKAILRRGPAKTISDVMIIDDLKIDLDLREITIAQNILSLTPIEYKLLHFFITHSNKVYTRRQLMDYIWGSHHYIDERTIDVQIKRLRHKLKAYNYHTRIQTVRGAGYYFSGIKK